MNMVVQVDHSKRYRGPMPGRAPYASSVRNPQMDDSNAASNAPAARPTNLECRLESHCRMLL